MTVSHDDEKNIRWTGFAASIPGGGHIRHGIPCQDASAVMTSPRPAAIVCDGRGSASLSHFGAQGAVEAFRFQMSIMEPFLVNILDGEEEKPDQWVKFCRIMYRTLMQVKYDLAEKHKQKEKEFDCTVAFAIAGEKRIGCFQVGDGSIVLRQNGVCKTVFSPEKGEFANQTHFLRPGGEEAMKFQFALLDSSVNSGIALTSDGPEHLMFQLADMTPGKIFDMFLDDLCGEELCQQDLMDYLTRREWADDPRGVDDRSLVLLGRVGVGSVVAAAPENDPKEIAVAEPEVTPAPEDVSDAKNVAEAQPETVAEVKDEPQEQSVDHKETEHVKKGTLPRLALALSCCFLIGLVAETACLWKQHHTISRQRAEILSLNRALAQRNLQIEQIQTKKTSAIPATPKPVAQKNEPKDVPAPRSESPAPVMKNGSPDVAGSEKSARADTTGIPDSEDIPDEDRRDED